MKRLNRRTFLKSSGLATATVGLSARSWAQVAGANGDIRVAIAGLGLRGAVHVGAFSSMKGVRVVALCDCDSNMLDRATKVLGKPVQTYSDVRKMIEHKDADVVSTATPNHWHSLITVWACQAGKDVYVEKPVSHNIFEGRQCVAAARRYGRIVQTGTQSRSSRQGVAQAAEWVKAGNLGKVLAVRGLCYKRRPSIGKVDGPQPIPAGVDYDLWCGPALKLPLLRKKFHYDWHWVWNTGNGDLGNQGVHQMDIARWFTGEMELAPNVWSIGGRLGYVDDGETVNTLIAYFGYTPVPLIYEVRGLPQRTGSKDMDTLKGVRVGVVIHCEGGHVAVPGYAADGAAAFDRDGKEIQKWSGTEDHFANFIKAVRSRKVEDFNADILEGHLSSALCHMINISYRLGRQTDPDEIRPAVKTDYDAQETLARMEQHLAANGVDIRTSKLTISPTLTLDPKTERFVNNARANELVTRPYRDSFVVPETV